MFVVLQLLVLISFIVACIAASRLSSEGTADSIAGFAAVWTALLLIVISIAGSIIMNRVSLPTLYSSFLTFISSLHLSSINMRYQ